MSGTEVGEPSDRVALAGERVELAAAFGGQLRKLRKGLGSRKGEFARACGISESLLSVMELGHREPRLQMIVVLARGLGLPGHELVRLAEQAAENAR